MISAINNKGMKKQKIKIYREIFTNKKDLFLS
jgi:hypothetical protein